MTPNVAQIQMDFQRTFITLVLDGAFFNEGQQYVLNVGFQSDVDVNDGIIGYAGFYHRPCSDHEDTECWYTQFESTNARNAFPCLDEPHLKANVTMMVERSHEFISHSNMPLNRTIPLTDSVDLDVYISSVKMSPYLIAVAIHNYKAKDGDILEGEPITKVWASNEDIEAGRGDYAAVVGPLIIKFYGDYFGVRYPLPKMDLMVEPHKGGAMENWGLILFSEGALLVDPDTTPEDRFGVCTVIAHELAHQWFGNLVTLAWWDQTWLNEGFATYVQYLGAQAAEPSVDAWASMYVRAMQRVMTIDQNPKVHWAMSDPVISRNDIERKFGTFSYQKGGSVIRMMEQMIGKETLTAGLNAYLSSLSYGAATEDDLFFHLEEVAMEAGAWPQAEGPQGSFGETMKTWTNQAGLPMVTVSKDCSATGECSLVFSQKWFVDGEDLDNDRVWDVPLTFSVISSGIQAPTEESLPQAWIRDLETKEVSVTGLTPDTPYVVNIDGLGYYRVNYDMAGWNDIAKTLKEDRDSIRPLNRAQIICDVIALEKNGIVSTEIKEEVLAYYTEDEEYAPKLAYERCKNYAEGQIVFEEDKFSRI